MIDGIGDKFDVNATEEGTGDTLLHVVCANGSLAGLRWLLDHGADCEVTNVRGVTPVFCAAAAGHRSIVEFLTSAGVQIDASTTADERRDGVAGAALAASASDVGAMAWTPLQAASAHGHVDVVRYLVHRGVRVNARCASGLTALHLGAMRGADGVVDVLLQANADAGITDDIGRRPADVAASGALASRLSRVSQVIGVGESDRSSAAAAKEEEESSAAERRIRKSLARDVATDRTARLSSGGEGMLPSNLEISGDDLGISMGSMEEDGAVIGTRASVAASRKAPRSEATSGEGARDAAYGGGGESSDPHALADDTAVAALPHVLVEAFGNEVARRLAAKSWKLREEAMLQVNVLLRGWSDSDKHHHSVGSETAFEACCLLLRLAVADKVPQVSLAATPVIRTLLDPSIAGVVVPAGLRSQYGSTGSEADGAAGHYGHLHGNSDTDVLDDFDVPRVDDDDGGAAGGCDALAEPWSSPSGVALFELLQALIVRMCESNERASTAASQTLHYIACSSVVGPLPIVHILFMSGEASAPTKAWKPLLKRLELLSLIVNEVGVDVPGTGLQKRKIMEFAVPALENASVKVRQAAIGVMAATAAHCVPEGSKVDEEQTEEAIPGLGGDSAPNPDEIVSSFVAEFLADVKPALLRVVEGKLLSAVEAAFGLKSHSTATPSSSGRAGRKGGARSRRGHSGSRAGTTKSGKKHQKRSEQRDATEGGVRAPADDELPYSEPLSAEALERAAPVSAVFGEDVARCAFSADWRPRVAALKHISARIKETQRQFAQPSLRGSGGYASRIEAATAELDKQVTAIADVMKVAIRDKVMAASVAGLRLCRRALRALGELSTDLPSARTVIIESLDCAVLRLADSKAKVRDAARELLLGASREPVIGARIAGDALLRHDEQASDVTGSPQRRARKGGGALVAARLLLIAELAVTVGFDAGIDVDASAAATVLPLRRVLDAAVAALEDREKQARDAAVRVMYVATRQGDENGFAAKVASVVASLDPAVRERLQLALVDLEAADAGERRPKRVGSEPGDTENRGQSHQGGSRVGGVRGPKIATVDADQVEARVESTASGAGADDEFYFDDRGRGAARAAPAVSQVARPNTAQRRRAMRSRGGLYTSGGGAAERVTDCLPYAEPIPSEMADEVAPLTDVFGEAAVRCLVSKAWSAREAAVVEVEKQLLLSCKEPNSADDVAAAAAAAAGSRSGVKALAKGSPEVLMQTAALVERSLGDTVMKVVKSALSLLKALCVTYSPTVAGREVLVRPALSGALSLVVSQTGHSQERIRGTSSETLIYLASPSVPAIPAALIGEVVLESIAEMNPKTAGNALAGRLGLLRNLVQECGITEASGLRVEGVVGTLMPTFANRHLDVRRAAAAVFAAVHASVQSSGGDTGPLREYLSELNPALRRSVSSAISAAADKAGFEDGDFLRGLADSPQRSGGIGPSRHASPITVSASGSLEASPRATEGTIILASDVDAVRALFGAEVADQLADASWLVRRTAMWTIAACLRGERKIGDGGDVDLSRVWEVVVRVAKAALMDPAPGLVVSALDVLEALTNEQQIALVGVGVAGVGSTAAGAEPERPPVSIPWESWEARLVLSSLVKSVVGRMSDCSVRVQEAAAEIAMLFARADGVGASLVARHLLAAVDIPKLPSGTAGSPAVVAAAATAEVRQKVQRSVHTLVARLRGLRELQDHERAMKDFNDGDDANTDKALELDHVLGFASKCLSSSSALVRKLATDCAMAAASTAADHGAAGVSAVRAFVSAANADTRARLQPILASLLSGGDDRPASVVQMRDLRGSSLSSFKFGSDVGAARGSSGPSARSTTPVAGRRAGQARSAAMGDSTASLGFLSDAGGGQSFSGRLELPPGMGLGSGGGGDGRHRDEGSSEHDKSAHMMDLIYGDAGPATAPTYGNKPFTPMADVPSAPMSAGGSGTFGVSSGGLAAGSPSGRIRHGRRAGSDRNILGAASSPGRPSGGDDDAAAQSTLPGFSPIRQNRGPGSPIDVTGRASGRGNFLDGLGSPPGAHGGPRARGAGMGGISAGAGLGHGRPGGPAHGSRRGRTRTHSGIKKLGGDGDSGFGSGGAYDDSSSSSDDDAMLPPRVPSKHSLGGSGSGSGARFGRRAGRD